MATGPTNIHKANAIKYFMHQNTIYIFNEVLNPNFTLKKFRLPWISRRIEL